MQVSFGSQHLDVAIALFDEEFTHDNGSIQMAQSGFTVTFFFPDDLFIREVRAWCADAFGCGLIFGPSVNLS